MNLLSSEQSPYLLQHKDNPVWWRPWSDAAFEEARLQDKPVFLSVGYSSCYWCHVMEKDSFEDPDVAAVLNRDFISIKVDREERPDIDQIYMDAVAALTGQGGWPMSVFLTHDRKPFWGGTFFPKQQFLKILRALAEAWHQDHAGVISSAKQVTEYLAKRSEEKNFGELTPAIFAHCYKQYAESYDEEHGGFGEAPKFPPSSQARFLFRQRRHLPEPDRSRALSMALDTLEHMARGGIYDQLEGGFHRYSTDERWLVPHFEKMLYDNALLVVSYLEAFQVSKREIFLSVARETLDYLLGRMQSREGGFCSAEDAGDVGREGEFYVWRYQELSELLSPAQLALACDLFGLSERGNFEQGQNVLTFPAPAAWEERDGRPMRELRERLAQARAQRSRPFRDEKVLTDWNGLTISALSKGYQLMGDRRYLDAAVGTAGLLRTDLVREGVLLHRLSEGIARFRACLDDYAFLIQGLLDLYESVFDVEWLVWARQLQEQQDERLWDPDGWGYYFGVGDELIIRRKDWHDGATPGGNSVSALNLLRLDAFYPGHGFRDKANRIMRAAAPLASLRPDAFPQLLIAYDFLTDNEREIVVSAPTRSAANPLLETVYSTFFPNKVLALALPGGNGLAILSDRTQLDGESTVYWCENKTCDAPFTGLNKLKEKLSAV